MSRKTTVIVVSVALVVVSFVYRFNTLGGALGGFDNDHFIYFVQARQMQHGERPLRDFADAGLQGAWPWPQYTLSLAGQRWLEPTLWPEGLLGAGALASATALTFVAASRVAPVWAALITSLLTLLIGTKLYNYPRILVLAVAVLLMIRYARAPSARTALALGVWGAVAFLFRHDFAVYVAAGVAVLVAARHRVADWRTAGQHLGLSALVAVALLVPSLVLVQRDYGLVRYVRTAAEMSARERQRTTIRQPWIVVDQMPVTRILANEDNAVAVVYYVAWIVPLLGLAALRSLRLPGFDERGVRALALGLIALTLVLNYSFLRGNIGARLGDLGAPLAVLAAMLAGRVLVDPPSWRNAWRIGFTAIILVLTTASVWTVGSVTRELDTAGLSDSWGKVQRRFVAAKATLRALPGEGPDATALPAAAVYLRHCTSPEDRVMVAGSDAAIIVMADLRFAGGHSTFTQGFYGSEQDQRETVDRLRGQRVPVVIAEEGDVYDRNFAVSFPIVYAWLQEHYRQAGHVGDGDQMRQVLVRRDGGSAKQDPPYAADRQCFS